MTVNPGADRNWLRPLHVNDTTIGSYRGTCEAFNVPSPLPGRRYHWANIADPNGIRRKAMRGFKFVTADDPEGRAWLAACGGPEAMVGRGGQLDSRIRVGSVALMWQPEERFRAEREEKARLVQSKLDGPTEMFLEEGLHMRAALGHRAPGGAPIYQRGASHGYHFETE